MIHLQRNLFNNNQPTIYAIFLYNRKIWRKVFFYEKMNLKYENDHEANIHKKAYRWKLGFALNDTKGKINKFELADILRISELNSIIEQV